MKKSLSSIGEACRKAPAALLVSAAVFLALVLELFVFQFSYFTQYFGGYQELRLDLSQSDGWNGEALPLLPENSTVSFDGLCLPVRSVTVETSGPSAVLSGNIGICDEASAYKTTGAGSFQVNPGGRENTFTVPVKSRGSLLRLRINFTDTLTEPVFLLSVTLNAHQSLTVHWLRLVLTGGFLSALFLILRFRLYREDYDRTNRRHRLLNLGALAFCLLISAGIFCAEAPGEGFLKPYPTLEEIRSPEMVVDAYMQQLDAFEKGQIALDLDVNPELAQMGNPYDKGERDAKGIVYHWDRAYYNGKYYSYFGLAPLFTVYYPVYFLTGMLPSMPFAAACLAVFAILAAFGAVQGLLRLFQLRANLLLLLTGEIALIGGSFLWLIQSSLSFYYLPLLSAIGWLSAFTALTCYAVMAEKSRLRILLFALCGVSVVMLVLSRPNTVILAAAFAAPLFLQILFDKNLSAKRRFLESACPFLIPAVIGGAAILCYNYIRFDSVFEFGTSYQLTETDIRWNSVSLSLGNLGGMLYHYFLEPFVYSEFFPFLRFTTDKCLDFGNYIYQECSAGLFQMPLSLGIFLTLPFLLGKRTAPGTRRLPASGSSGQASLHKKDVPAKPIVLLLLLGILILGLVNYTMAGIHIRYVSDLGLAVMLLSLVMLLSRIHFDDTRSAKILYAVVLSLLLLTIGRGLAVIFSNETNNILDRNPDFYLWISRMFGG